VLDAALDVLVHSSFI